MRNDWTKIQSETIDWLRPVMAFMVICLHIQLFYVDKQWSVNGGFFDIFVIFLCKIICPAAVPTFFFISGYLFFKGLEEWKTDVWKRKLKKRIHSLLIPYLLWNLISMIAFPLTRYAGSIRNNAFLNVHFWCCAGLCYLLPHLSFTRTLFAISSRCADRRTQQ